MNKYNFKKEERKWKKKKTHFELVFHKKNISYPHSFAKAGL